MSLTAATITVGIIAVVATLVLGLIAWTALRVRRARSGKTGRSAADGPWYFERHQPPPRNKGFIAG